MGRPAVDICRVLPVAVDSLLVVESGANDAAGGAAASSSRSNSAPTIVVAEERMNAMSFMFLTTLHFVLVLCE